ncbi:MAG: metallophosphoesterase [Polyangiaceae bacterium]
MRIALVTDVHFGPPGYFAGKLRKLSHEAAPLTAQFVEAARAADADVIVNLGDVVEDESAAVDRERYATFMQLLRASELPLLHVAGNHDQICMTQADLIGMWERSGELYYYEDIGELRFVVLSTVETKDVSVRLPEVQLRWLDEVLVTPRPVVILMHHPAGEMVLTGNRWFERAPHICRVAERRELRRVLARHANVVAVFNGHAHWNYLEIFDGVPYVTLQSLTENLDEDAPGRPARAWALCDITTQYVDVSIHGEEPARLRVARKQ